MIILYIIYLNNINIIYSYMILLVMYDLNLNTYALIKKFLIFRIKSLNDQLCYFILYL